MDTIQKANSLLRSTEADLRKLIELAVQEGRYSDVAKLAEIADLLGKIISRAEVNDVSNLKSPGRNKSESQNLDVSEKLPKRQKSGEFPKFEIERDRLVKVGWSKKDRKIYEHRAERNLVQAASLHLARVTNQEVFKMDEILPISLEDGADVPSYQAYLVLAWLRHVGLVEKQGKDGYQWTVERFDEPAFNAAWKSTPQRA
jgi:hypothetical protein